MRTWYKLAKLGLTRLRSVQDYQALQKYIAEASVEEIEACGIRFTDARVLELGAGFGGYSLVLNQRSKYFIASDFHDGKVFAELGLPYRQVDVTRQFPFVDHSWDLIYCSSVIEHIADPTVMLTESWRVLRPGGWLFLSFPPFYSLFMIGGHHFKPFHFFGERLAVQLTNLFYRKNYDSYATSYGTWGLYPLAIDQVAYMVRESGFNIVETYTRMSSVNTTKLPAF